MTPEQIRQIVREEIQKSSSSSRFGLAPISRHIHNNIDSPFVFQPILTYSGLVGVGNSVTFVAVTATGAFVGGEVSATLTVAWPYQTGQFTTTFSNGDSRAVNYTNSSASVTWSGGLSGAATVDMVADGVKAITVNFLPIGWSVDYDLSGSLYTITHNLGTDFYAITANSAQSTNIYGAPVIEGFADSLTIKWADAQTGGGGIATGFYFTLTVINNKKNTVPSYYGTLV